MGSDMGVDTLRDVITDFVRSQGDKIDLTTVDANTAVSGVQDFALVSLLLQELVLQ